MLWCVLIVIIGSGMIAAKIALEYRKLRDVNQSPLLLKTFDGSNSPYHPSVKYFISKWNGYQYWMAETPFYPYSTTYRDRNECPCIHVSNDGLHWKNIIPNPIDDLSEKEQADCDYFSDCHLLVRGDTLECWYRKTNRSGKNTYSPDNVHYLLRKYSTDGIHWSEREILMDISEYYGCEMISPAIIYEDRVYKMWGVELTKDSKDHQISCVFSNDAKHWIKKRICNLSGNEVKPWHIDVEHFDGFYWFVCYESTDEISLWKSEDGQNFQYVKTLLKTCRIKGAFYSNGLYRSSIVKVSDNDYRLYFSAEDEFSTHIGMMQGKTMDSLKMVPVDAKPYLSYWGIVRLYLFMAKRSMSFRLKHTTWKRYFTA